MPKRSAIVLLVVGAAAVAAMVWGWPRIESALLALHGVRVASASGGKASKVGVVDEGWPKTRAGVIAQQWVAAYDSGDVAMRGFYERSMSRESLAKKSPEARLEGYRKLKDRVGKLMLAHVVDSRETELAVSLLAEDGVPREFIFTLEEKPPHKLLTVTLREMQRHGGGSHGSHP